VAAHVAAVAGHEARYVVDAAFDNEYYRDLILRLIDRFGQATPMQARETLLSKLPAVLSDQQKTTKIRNLVYDLVKRGAIHNVGGNNPGARWVRRDQAS